MFTLLRSTGFPIRFFWGWVLSFLFATLLLEFIVSYFCLLSRLMVLILSNIIQNAARLCTWVIAEAFSILYYKTRELLRYLLAEVSAPNGSFSKIKSEPSQLSRVSERFVLSHWVIGQYTGLDISFLSCLLVPELCTSPSLFIVRY